MQFTADQIASMAAVFSNLGDERIRTALPLILEEWGRTELTEYFARRTPKEFRQEQRQLEQVAKLAADLGDAVSRLDRTAQFVLASRLPGMAGRPKKQSRSRVTVTSKVVSQHLDTELNRLQALAQAAAETAAEWVALPFRAGSVRHHLILQDLAAIFEYVTGERASRRVRGEDHPEAGQDYGPFWNFAATAWPAIFGSTRGLSAALKRWADARIRFGEASALVANMALRHPEWRIYED